MPAIGLAVCPIAIDAPVTNQLAKLSASDGFIGDEFGLAVAISDGTAVVGAPNDDDNGDDSGSAYVFQQNQGGAGSWGQVVKLTASDGAMGDTFGSAVSVWGDTAVIGASLHNADTGACYVFQRDAGGADMWGQVAKLVASDGALGDYFASSVAISDDTIVVGSPSDDDTANHSGSCYVFERDAGGIDNWGQVAKLVASDAAGGDSFGTSVSVSGDLTAVGAFGTDALRGSAYVFERDEGGIGNWGQVAKLTPYDGADTDFFGFSISISGDTVLVGSPRHSACAFDVCITGAAYVYQRDEGGANNWGQVEEVSPVDVQPDDRFGWSVGISGDLAVVSSMLDDDNGFDSGSAYFLERNEGGSDLWGEVSKLHASDANAADLLGWSVGISGDTAVVGARWDDDNGPSSGSAYIFGAVIAFNPYCFGVGCPCSNDDSSAGCVNGSGAGALLTATGSNSVAQDDLVLTARSVPLNQFGIFFMGGGQIQTPFGDGQLCVGSGGIELFRYPVHNSGGTGTVAEGPGIIAHSQANFGLSGAITSGQTWYFQAWFRDPLGPCGSAFNLSNGLAVTFKL